MPNGFLDTIPADSDTPCGVCGRTHRELKKVFGIWCGSKCGDDLRWFIHRMEFKSGSDLADWADNEFGKRKAKQLMVAAKHAVTV